MSTAITKPVTGEFMPYFGKYIDLVSGADAVAALRSQIKDTQALVAGLSEAQGGFRYAPGKWSIKEVLGHLCDCERIFIYRALRIARGDQTPLSGFEENDFAAESHHDKLTLAQVGAELVAIRAATIALLENLDESTYLRTGTVNDNKISVRALAYCVAGHELHHVGLIRSRYLNQAVASNA